MLTLKEQKELNIQDIRKAIQELEKGLRHFLKRSLKCQKITIYL